MIFNRPPVKATGEIPEFSRFGAFIKPTSTIFWEKLCLILKIHNFWKYNKLVFSVRGAWE